MVAVSSFLLIVPLHKQSVDEDFLGAELRLDFKIDR